MSVSSVGQSTSAYSYLQSLLSQSSAGTAGSDPVSQLLSAFYPSGSGSPTGSATGTTDPPMSGGSCSDFSPDTMATLISAQDQLGGSGASQAQSLFTQFDTNSDGQISQSEFDSAFGPNADMTKVNGLFNALDTNGDGSISQDELTSAAQQSQAQHAQHHHHHHAHGAGGSGGGDGLSDLLSSTDAAGATSSTASNTDGSTTTTITYADGSTVSMTTAASTGADGGDSSDGNSNANGNSSSSTAENLLEQLIQMQAQFLTPSMSQTLATI